MLPMGSRRCRWSNQLTLSRVVANSTASNKFRWSAPMDCAHRKPLKSSANTRRMSPSEPGPASHALTAFRGRFALPRVRIGRGRIGRTLQFGSTPYAARKGLNQNTPMPCASFIGLAKLSVLALKRLQFRVHIRTRFRRVHERPKVAGAVQNGK
jgi:hypothetical protein